MRRAVDSCGLSGSLLKTGDKNTKAIKGEKSSGGEEGNYEKDDTPIRKAQEFRQNLEPNACQICSVKMPKLQLYTRSHHSSRESFIIYSSVQKSAKVEFSVLFWPEKWKQW